MDTLKKLLSGSIKDYLLSKDEKKAIRNALSNYKPDNKDGDRLRALIFDMAREHITVENNFSILTRLENVNKLLLNTNQQATETYETIASFSPGTECSNLIISEIKNASQTVDICVFTISDNLVSNEILAAHRKGIKVRVITDDEKLNDKGSDILWLAKKGVPIKIDRTRHHMHHKYAIFDKTRLLTGSYNWTRSARQYNHENIALTTNELLVKEFNRNFKELWQEMISLSN